tara:strand:+ start:199 stop:1161 length:963 start_codon:yes stop_codon:yes gene_type:complete
MQLLLGLLTRAALLRTLPLHAYRAASTRVRVIVAAENGIRHNRISPAELATLRMDREEDCLLETRDFCAATEGAVILLRHGESRWNEENRFTGWHDVPLSARGEEQAAQAAETLLREGICFDSVYVSTLKRTIKTAWVILEKLDDFTVPVKQSWRLNERNYGALTGLNKAETRDFLGEERFEEFRRQPPPIESDSCYNPARSQRFRSVPEEDLPTGESFEDCQERVRPFWRDEILPLAKAGRTVLVVSSKNLLRSLFVEITDIPTNTLVNVDIPNGVPILFDPATNTLRLLDDQVDGKGRQFLPSSNSLANEPALNATAC